MYKNRMSALLSAMLMITVVLGLTGCFAGKRASSAQFSGWMTKDEYKLLKQNKGKDKPIYGYVKPDVNYAFYTKMMIDPVVVYRPNKEAAPEDLQKAANNFYSILVNTLKKDYQMAVEPGPATLRVQVAVTHVSEGSSTMQAISSVIPIGIGASYMTDWVTGKPPFTGEASIEVKIIDSRTGELLGAAVDRRIADRNMASVMSTWDAVVKVEEIWAKLFAFRLCQERGEKDCVPPAQE